MISEDRFLVSFKQHSHKKKEKSRTNFNQTTRENTKIMIDDTEAEDKLISGFLKSDANAMYDDSQKTQQITTRKSLATEYDNSEVRQIDDWNIISDSKSDIKIKAITVYACHYILALEVLYQEPDLTEYRVVHSGSKKYLNDRGEVEKRTLELENDEFIDFIGYSMSSQKKYIRSMKIGTTGGHLMIVEGQVELNNISTNSVNNSAFSSFLQGVVLDKEKRYTTVQKFEPNKTDNETGSKHELIGTPHSERLDRTYGKKAIEDSKSTREGSIDKKREKEQILNLAKQNQRVVGLRTRFTDFLIGIDLYTEPCPYKKS